MTGFPAGAGLDDRILEVQIIELDLHNIHFGVPRQDTVQDIRRIMEGKADAVCFPRPLQFLQKVKAACFFRKGGILSVQTVEQIDIKPFYAAALQLLCKDVLRRPSAAECAARQFVRDHKILPRIPLDQGQPKRFFTFAAEICIRRIKIAKAPLQEAIHHLLCQLEIHIAGIIAVRQAQKAKAQFSEIHRRTPFTTQHSRMP